MGVATKISWADHTWNPWVGCTQVSPACDHCYAEGWAKRTGSPELWQGERRRTTKSNWQQPYKWGAAARKRAKRARVFCCSLADIWDNQVPIAWLADALDVMARTPDLDWLLLTKRPQNIRRRLEAVRDMADLALREWIEDWLAGKPPENVWLGTTVENQEEADRRIPHLLAIPARVRFLSCEPLLGPVALSTDALAAINWVIVGGESGGGARPMHPVWARSLREQCARAGVAYHFKQWGEYAPANDPDDPDTLVAINGMQSGTIGAALQPAAMDRLGTKRAGRELDGRTWDEFPTARAA